MGGGGGGGGEEEMEALMQGMMTDNTQKLTSAVSSLPALLEKKRKIDMHMSMATSVLEQVITLIKLLLKFYLSGFILNCWAVYSRIFLLR